MVRVVAYRTSQDFVLWYFAARASLPSSPLHQGADANFACKLVPLPLPIAFYPFIPSRGPRPQSPGFKARFAAFAARPDPAYAGVWRYVGRATTTGTRARARARVVSLLRQPPSLVIRPMCVLLVLVWFPGFADFPVADTLETSGYFVVYIPPICV
jgi:hypothetical protein